MGLDTDLTLIKTKIKELEGRIEKIEQGMQGKPISKVKKPSLKEFLLSKKPRGDVQKTLAIGYFLEMSKDFLNFNVKDLETYFRKAKEPVPSNINNRIIRNIEKGYIEEYDKKKDGLKTWCLTQSGIDCVENNFKRKE